MNSPAKLRVIAKPGLPEAINPKTPMLPVLPAAQALVPLQKKRAFLIRGKNCFAMLLMLLFGPVMSIALTLTKLFRRVE